MRNARNYLLMARLERRRRPTGSAMEKVSQRWEETGIHPCQCPGLVCRLVRDRLWLGNFQLANLCKQIGIRACLAHIQTAFSGLSHWAGRDSNAVSYQNGCLPTMIARNPHQPPQDKLPTAHRSIRNVSGSYPAAGSVRYISGRVG